MDDADSLIPGLWEALMFYGAACMRQGELKAQAIEAARSGQKKAARRFWGAYYEEDGKREKMLKRIRKMVEL